MAPDSPLRLASFDLTTKPIDGGLGPMSARDSIDLPPSKPSLGPRGQVSVYDPSVLPVINSEPSSSVLWPSWRRGIKRWQWIRIPDSDLSSVLPTIPVPGDPRNRIDAWNGLAADTRGNRLFSVGNGGHADYSGNEVYQIDLSVDSPHWVLLREPSRPDDIVRALIDGVRHDYYLDGRPSSTHTYYALNYLATRDAIFKFGSGSLWGSGNEANWKTDAFSLESKDWQPAGTWPDVIPEEPTGRGSTAASICMNPATEEVYIAGYDLRRFDPVTGTFANLGADWPQNASATYARGCAVDPVRNRVVYFGDAYKVPLGGLVYDIASNAISAITFSGESVAEITTGASFAWYEPKIGKFLLKTNLADHVYAIDPISFEVSRVMTIGGEEMPDAANGVQTRWQRMPALGGYAYYARHGDGIWFLAVE